MGDYEFSLQILFVEYFSYNTAVQNTLNCSIHLLALILNF